MGERDLDRMDLRVPARPSSIAPLRHATAAFAAEHDVPDPHAAERIALRVPGVSEVRNELTVW